MTENHYQKGWWGMGALRQVPMKYPYKRSRWALLRWLDIEDEQHPGLVYLRRLILFKTPWVSLYLHWIYRPDGGGDPHNHPFSFLSLILRGGYVESRFEMAGRGEALPYRRALPDRARSALSVGRTNRRTFHRITWAESPTVTLVLAGPSRQEWGFLDPLGGYRSALASPPGGVARSSPPRAIP